MLCMASTLIAQKSLVDEHDYCTMNGEWCPLTTSSIARVSHQDRGVVPLIERVHDCDPRANTFIYHFPLSAIALRDVMGVAASGKYVPKAEGGCAHALMDFPVSILAQAA